LPSNNNGYLPLVGAEPGRLIAGQYRLVEEIGRGGFGVVWRARDEHLHRDVAAKELFVPSYLSEEQRNEQRERSLREARSAARLAHPGAVTVYAVIEHDNTPWIIMELIEGRSLATIVKTEGPLPPRRVAEIGLEVLRALRAAHAAGVIHRDVKPANILISDRRVVLTDFGIARIEGDPNITQSGFIMGAPAYTAPERARGESAIAASDLWSLGASLYYAVEGHRPFPGANAQAVFHAIMTADPIPLRKAGPLAQVINGLLRKDAAERLSAAVAAELLGDAVLGDLPWLDETGAVDADSDLLGKSGKSGKSSHARHVRHADTEPSVRAHGTSPLNRRQPGRGRMVAMFAVPALAAVIALSILGTALRQDEETPQRQRQASAPEAQRPTAQTVHFEDAINAVAYNRDGGTLAVGGEDRTLELWNVAANRPLATLPGPKYNVFAAAFSPDGKILATGGYDGEVLLWNTVRRTRVATLRPPAEHPNSISTVAFSPDGTTLASASDDAVRLWSVRDRRLIRTLPTQGESVFTLAFSPVGRTLATAGTQAIRLWRDSGRGPGSRVAELASTVRAMAFSPNGKTIATAGYNGRVELWDIAGRRRSATLGRYDKTANAIAFNPSGTLVACADGRTIAVWNATTRRQVAALAEHTGTVNAIAFSPNGRGLASAGEDATVRMWDLRSLGG
jgi:serine/threonine protein kinase